MRGLAEAGRDSGDGSAGVADGGTQQNVTAVFRENLILLGEDGTADDLRGRSIFHLTLNAKGEIVAFKAEFSLECA